MPIFRAVLMTRQAISPRLAMRILVNMRKFQTVGNFGCISQFTLPPLGEGGAKRRMRVFHHVPEPNDKIMSSRQDPHPPYGLLLPAGEGCLSYVCESHRGIVSCFFHVTSTFFLRRAAKARAILLRDVLGA